MTAPSARYARSTVLRPLPKSVAFSHDPNLVLFAALANPKVSLDVPFQPLDAVVRAVAERTGENLAVAAFLTREIRRQYDGQTRG